MKETIMIIWKNKEDGKRKERTIMVEIFAPTDFEVSGLDAEELEFMDVKERRKVLEEAGLDPEVYDF